MVNVRQTHIVPKFPRLANMAWTFDLTIQHAFNEPDNCQCVQGSKAQHRQKVWVCRVILHLVMQVRLGRLRYERTDIRLVQSPD